MPMVSYHDLPLLRRYEKAPEGEPTLLPDVAQVPVWLVPPGWRLARLSALVHAAGLTVAPEDVSSLLTQLHIRWNTDGVGVWGWNTPVVTWKVTGTSEYLVLWRVGRDSNA